MWDFYLFSTKKRGFMAQNWVFYRQKRIVKWQYVHLTHIYHIEGILRASFKKLNEKTRRE